MFDQIKIFLGSKENKNLYSNIVGAFIIKGLSLIISLFTMPAYMSFFSDQEVLGVWFTLLSVLNWVLSFDLGIGNGLRNKLCYTIAANDTKQTKEYISSAYFITGAVSLILLILLSFFVYIVDWNKFFNISTNLVSHKDLSVAILICLMGILFQFFLRLISSIIYALQKSAINNFMSLLTSLLQLMCALFLPSKSPSENLIVFSCVHVLCVNVPLIFLTCIVFLKLLPQCKPNVLWFRRDKARFVMSLGGIFFLCQILYMIIANTNEFFISHYSGSDNVVEYQIYYRLFSLASMLITLALTPVWSAVTKAIAERNYVWLNKLYKYFKKFSLLGIVCEFLLIPFLQFIIDIWLGENALTVNYHTSLFFAIFGSLMLYQSVLSTFVCGLGRLKLQAICYFIGVIFKLIFIPVAVNYFGRWEIVIIANIFILLPYCILQQIDLDKYMKKNIS